MTAVYEERRLPDTRRRELIFQGDIVVFRGLSKMRELCALAESLLREAFEPHDPETVQFELDTPAFLGIVGPLQRRFTNHPDVKKLFRATLEEAGVKSAETYWDWFPLRIAPDGGAHRDRNTLHLQPHRDTWYGGDTAQNNWWGPILPIETESSLAIYPRYWTQPVKNNTDSWDLVEFRRARAEATAGALSLDALLGAYPLPAVEESVDPADELRLVPEPGDLVCFSSAHLHCGVPNSSGKTRFSTEVRSINVEDLRQGRGAPNVDSKSTGDTMCDFHHIADGTPIIQRSAEVPA